MTDSNRPGFLPDGSGPDGEAFGRDPVSQRAYKRNGEVRKARTVKSVEEQMADLAQAEKRAHGTMGRKVLAANGAFAAFMGAFGKFQAWVREAKAYATPEKREERVEALQRQIDTIEAKGEAAVEFLTEQGEAIAQANGVFAKVGAAYLAFSKATGRAPDKDEGVAIVAEVVNPEAVEAVEAAANPEADPFLAFRRDTVEVEQPDDDDDTL